MAGTSNTNDTPIRIYYIDIKGQTVSEDCLNTLIHALPKQLCEKCLSAGSMTVRTERALAYTALACALHEHGVDTDECEIGFAEYGKPYLVDGEFQFSISHSDLAAAIAIQYGNASLGIDIQAANDKNTVVLPRLLESFFKDANFPSLDLSEFVEDDRFSPTKTPSINLIEIRLSEDDSSTPKLTREEGMVLPEKVPSPVSLWARAEAILKMDGRGFTASKKISEIKPRATLLSATLVRRAGLPRMSIALAIENKQ